MTDFPHLLSPLRIACPSGYVEVRNRVMVSAHVPGFADRNKAGEAYVNYHRQYAANGVGLQMTGGTPVHHSGLLGAGPDGLWNLDDSVIPGYQNLAAAVHDEGGRILAQLAHSGGTVLIENPGTASWSASAIRSESTGRVAHAMSLDEIDEVVQAYANAAARVRQGGLDGVEILSAFGFLPQAFLSPLTNHRSDNYGGTPENRLRFLITVLEAVRKALAPNQILGVRLPGDEYEPGGLDLQQMKLVCQSLAERGLVDYINVIAHTNFSLTGRSKHWAPTPTKHGVFVELASAIRRTVTVPVFTVGRVVDPAHADRIIADGHADMVGMTRAHICDPQIVKKIRNNQLSQIRPCVGANTCIANRYAGKQIRCMHNPMVKMPGVVLSQAKKTKKVVVIGAGPAGLETARLAASRGHQVVLYERNGEVGGQLRLWASSTSMKELGRIIDWRTSELQRLGVVVNLNCHIDSSALQALEADAIVVTTGAMDREDNKDAAAIAGIQFHTPLSLLQRESVSASHAIVSSDGRGQAGLVAAERLLENGASVEIITSDYAVAADLDPTNRNAWYERLGKAGAIFTPQTQLADIHKENIKLVNVFSQQTSKRTSVDMLVNWSGSTSIDGLLHLEASSYDHTEWFSAGDCLAPRTVEVAMAEALAVSEVL